HGHQRVAIDVGVGREPEVLEAFAEAEKVADVRKTRDAHRRAGEQAQAPEGGLTTCDMHGLSPHDLDGNSVMAQSREYKIQPLLTWRRRLPSMSPRATHTCRPSGDGAQCGKLRHGRLYVMEKSWVTA